MPFEQDDTLAADSPPASPSSARGHGIEQIGKYKLLTKLGEGGMGEVWLAEQETPRRKVAVKVIKRGMDTRQVIARFETERQALGVMDHPTIARVFEAGETERGRPYFVMEYVKGEPINRYCDRNRLTTRERLRLFIQVCEGVQHAHQKAVIHRDLKPSNILVTVLDDQPVPKIIDFGVAKATSQRLTERTLFTELGQLIGTPEYMSPEQAEMTGTDVDTRTDVYALGVVLYQLLTGVLPLSTRELREGGLAEIQRRIREDEPSKPSTRVSSLGAGSSEVAERRRVDVSSLVRRLRGDLDWVTIKALEKDRTRRYQTANELALDVRRHLDDEPVRARPPSGAYRLTKFVRRHRTGVAFGAVLAILLIAAAVGATVQARRIAIERDRAEREAERALAINEFLEETLGAADPWKGGGREVTIVEALEQGARRADVAFEGQPLIAAEVKNTIGRTYVALGRLDEAKPLLESALASRREIVGDEDPAIAESFNGLGYLHEMLGEYSEAADWNRRALAIYEATIGEQTLEAAETLSLLASHLTLTGDFEGADQAARRSLEVRRRLFPEQSSEVASGLYILATVHLNRSQYDEAEEASRRALEIRRRTRGSSHPEVGLSLNQLAVIRMFQQDYDEAETLYREALEVQRAIFGERHLEVAVVLENLGNVAYRRGDLDETLELLEQVLAMRKEMGGERHTQVGRTLANIGVVSRTAGRHEQALAALDESVGIMVETLGENHPDVASILKSRVTAHHNLGGLTAARDDLARALAIQKQVYGEDHPIPDRSSLELATLLIEMGDLESAARLIVDDGVGSVDGNEEHRRQAVDRLVAAYEKRGDTDIAADLRARLASVDADQSP